jgi:dTDP-4-amino-4,6-dideoxygalactose transaminase
MGFAAEDFPEAVTYYREAISLPMFQGLADEQQDQVVDVLKSALAGSDE